MWIVPWDLFLMKKLLKSEICGSRDWKVAEKLIKRCWKSCWGVHSSHYIKSTITAHKERKKKEKKKTETSESPDVDAKRRNNPIQTHTKNAQN